MSDQLTSRVDHMLRTAVDRGDVPGMAAAAADTDGVRYSGAAGSKGNGPMTADTVMWIASMSKVVTSVAALQQVERGALDLDVPLADVLPELAELVVLTGFDDDGTPRTRPARTPVTLRHALSHTAGWGYEFLNADLARYHRERGVPPIIACQDRTLADPLLFEPGTGWEYGTNVDWVGKAVERVTGTDLERYLAEQLFAPLDMVDTGFAIGGRRPRLAGMNARTPDGGTAPMDFEMPQDPEFLMGGGGLYSTPNDYLRFLRMLLGRGELGGTRVLAEELIEQGMRNQIGELTVGRICTVDPTISFDVDLLPGTTKKWGLLGMINVEDTAHGRSAGSLFWAGLSNCYYWVDWSNGDTGVLFSQLLPFADAKVLARFDEFESTVRASGRNR